MLSRKTSIVSYSRVYLQASWNFPLRERGLRFLRVFCMDTQDHLVRSPSPPRYFPMSTLSSIECAKACGLPCELSL